MTKQQHMLTNVTPHEQPIFCNLDLISKCNFYGMKMPTKRITPHKHAAVIAGTSGVEEVMKRSTVLTKLSHYITHI